MDRKEELQVFEVKKQTRRINRLKISFALIIVLLALAVLPTIGTITGDGFSWKSFPTYYGTVKGSRALINGDKSQLEGCIGFSGIYGAKTADELASYLDFISKEGIRIVDVDANLLSCTLEDRFPHTAITLTVQVASAEYQIECLGTVQDGKLVLIRFYDEWLDNPTDPFVEEVAAAWIADLEQILCTYDPG